MILRWSRIKPLFFFSHNHLNQNHGNSPPFHASIWPQYDEIHQCISVSEFLNEDNYRVLSSHEYLDLYNERILKSSEYGTNALWFFQEIQLEKASELKSLNFPQISQNLSMLGRYRSLKLLYKANTVLSRNVYFHCSQQLNHPIPMIKFHLQLKYLKQTWIKYHLNYRSRYYVLQKHCKCSSWFWDQYIQAPNLCLYVAMR